MPNTCKNCGEKFKPRWKTTEQFCSMDCAYQSNKRSGAKTRSPIKRESSKRAKENALYRKRRIAYLNRPENAKCFVDGCRRKATTIEHRRGRVGALLLDERYWAPCCLQHNLEFESNPDLARKYQLSKIHGGKKI